MRTRITASMLCVVAAGMLGLASSAGASTGTIAAHNATATCTPGTITVAPTMQVAQSVLGQPSTASGQNVAYRAFLYHWNGSTWSVAQTGSWLWGYGTSGQVTSFHSFGTNAVATTSFRVASGYYSVGVQYYWYANTDVGSGSDYTLAQHVDLGGPNGNGYCKL